MKLRATLPIGLFALAALALAAQGLDLKWTPKVGDKATYKMSGKFELAGLGEATISGTRKEEITKIEEGTVEAVSSSSLVANFGGNETPIPDSKETVKTKLDGMVVDIKVDGAESPAGALRFGHMTMFVFPGKPVAINDTWVSEAKKDEKLDLPGYKLEFKLVGEEKFGAWDTYKITGKGSETEGEAPTKIDATFWIEKSTGNMVRNISEFKDAVISGMTLSGKMEAVRQP